MPGYVMHLAQAQMVIDEIRKHTEVSEEWIQAFKTGNLLPDTKLFDKKVISHFWDPEEDGNLERAPKLDRFLGKYMDKLDQPVMLGYLMHLHLDQHYVESYWPGIISFYNAEGQREKVREKIVYVKIHRTGEQVPLDRFFSVDYYYGDYNRMNDHFIKAYGLTLPDWHFVKDFPMDEVRLSDMEIVCGHLHKLLDRDHNGAHEMPKVFDLADLENYMTEMAESFMKEYAEHIPGLCAAD